MHNSKRELGTIFQKRLRLLLQRSGLNQAQFSASIGINRSALGLLLSEDVLRMPRAETLSNIAVTHHVSVDWLLGLSQNETLSPAVSSAMAIEQVVDGHDTVLAKWHKEAIGYKIRYVPARLPDSLLTEQVIEYERLRGAMSSEDLKREASFRLAYNRITESDMEVCIPLQRLTMLAKGEGIWACLSTAARREQLRHMSTLLEDLYPTYRLFLYDELKIFSAPITIFGSQRAAVFMGDMYVVITAREEIRAVTHHFDELIRQAVVNPHETSDFIRGLL